MDAQAFGADVVAAVRSFLELELDPLLARVEAMEQRFAALPIPKDGKDADPADVAAIVTANVEPEIAKVRADLDALKNDTAWVGKDISDKVAEAVAALPSPKDGEDGKSITLDDVSLIIAEEVAKAVSAIPAPKDGKDGSDGTSVDPVAVEAMVTFQVAAAVANLPVPADGKDADPELVASLIAIEVAKLPPAVNGKDGLPGEPGRDGADALDLDLEVVKTAIVEHVEATLAGWERPQDGKSVTAEELHPLIEESTQRAVAAIPAPKDGKDGLDAVSFLRDAQGHLIATMSNGTVRDLGQVDGKDGSAGADGKDGTDGKAGEPGFGFEDMTEELADDGRTIIRRYTRGDQVKEFRHSIAVVLDRGVFKEGSTYVAGDGVTWAGSFWIAQDETTEKPDTGKGWRLAVKRGRDGKDGRTLPPIKTAPVKVG